MLARAEVANDLLFRNPKRVVIEGGALHADRDTLESLADVRSPGAMAAAAAAPAEPDPTDPGALDCSSTSYKAYPPGDERGLPAFILECATMGELDAATGAWAQALDALADGEFWRAVIGDADGLRARAPLHLSAKVRAGVPPAVRGVVWQTLTQARSTYLQTVYSQLVQEHSPHERVIRRDLPRTFPRVPVFKSEGGEAQQRLFRILKAYSLYDAEVGYCQGLGFIIGPLIMSMGECEAFCVLVRLMETYDLRGMFTEDMAGLHLRLFQFQALAAEVVPDVMRHLEAHGVVPAMYVPSWFLSLFAYTMPLSFVLRAMDVIMAERAPETIIRIGIALLQRNAARIMAQDDFEAAMGVLNAGLYDDEARAQDRPGLVLDEAARLASVVTAARLAELEAQYHREQLPPQGADPTAPTAARRWGVVPAANHAAIVKFLGWPWGAASKDAPPSAPLSTASTPRPLTTTTATATATTTTGAPSLGSGGGPHWRNSSSASRVSSNSSDSGTLSPRTLELTQAQMEHSRQLREQMLWTLQAQADAPATTLGPLPPLHQHLQGPAGGGGGGDEEVKQRGEPSPPLMTAKEPAAVRRCSTVPDSSWRDEVLEPLQRQLHDARVSSDSHRDALAALRADHEALHAQLVVAKVARAELADECEQLRLRARRADADVARAHDRAAAAEHALVDARVQLAEAEEERALLVRQLDNLRAFIASDPAAAAAATAAEAAALSPRQSTNRFSISSIASNLSALREAIPEPSASAAASPPPPASRHSAAIPLAMLHRSKTLAAVPAGESPPQSRRGSADDAAPRSH
ncbi:hypothetical protein H4R18_002282 [Coemansia javaensis]|uniref:Rab-GAP TBC domain-containing protein n=1 Tax=Coemansia javaensis TaxID=2761396 RepID=A0A9W8HDD2_9FUNG|nr:hypothetical protein H4R18_002282 [Coemansia javaensis]